MPELYEYELGKAADILTRELFRLQEGETLVITADTESDPRVVDATARAAFACGAKPLVVWIPAPLGVGKAADPMLPQGALTALLKEADAWVEFNNQWLLYSTPYDIAVKENKKLRHLCLVGMNVDMMVRCIGRVNYPVLKEFEEKLAEMTRNAKHVRMTTPAGEDVEFENDPNHPVNCELGYADTPGSHMMSGQVAWSPKLDSINGVIVFDGSVVPPIGLLKEPIRLTVEKGKIVNVEGGKEAVEFESWLRSFNHPQMFQMAHVCYGFNPGAKLTGDILEDERVWGCTEWGVGNIGAILIPPDGIPAPSHSDGICLNTSVWLDGKLIIDKGRVVDEELKRLAALLGKE
ncbi:aminopeptidase [Atrimonas thermophila]|uniref:aminopeptidase n=1 Tax=Atrimonas thermophila TaxID=3064161 RepID=UPI00399C7DE1